MLSLYQHKFCPALAALLVCMIAVLAIACEFHLPSHPHAHQAPADSHPSSSVDAPGDGLCLIAVLPAVAYVPVLLGVMFLAMPLFLALMTRVSLLFRPPKLLLV